jgi:hypothetical protein
MLDDLSGGELLVFIFLAVIFIIAGPLLFIGAINVLFGLSIEYTFINWLCAFYIGFFFRASGSRTN